MNVYRMLQDDCSVGEYQADEELAKESGHCTSFGTPVGQVTLFGYVTEDGVSLAVEDVPLFHPDTGEPLTFVEGVAPYYLGE